MSNYDASLSTDTQYHYALAKANRATVREQAKKINHNLRLLKRASSPELPLAEGVQAPTQDTRESAEDITEEFVTLPPSSDENTETLKLAIQNAKVACQASSHPPPNPGRKKRRWFGWDD